MGFQCHLNVGINYNYENLRENIKRFIELGVEVYITELDVGLNLWGQGGNHKKVSGVIKSQSDWNNFLKSKTKYIIIWLKRQKNRVLNLLVIGVLEMIFHMVGGEKIKRHGW